MEKEIAAVIFELAKAGKVFCVPKGSEIIGDVDFILEDDANIYFVAPGMPRSDSKCLSPYEK